MNSAEKLAAKMKDEYVSVEHVMLGIFDNQTQKIKRYSAGGINKEDFLRELDKVKTSRSNDRQPEASMTH